MTQQIIGLRKEMIDPDSGAPVEFYTLTQYTVRPGSGTSQATFQGYVSQASFVQNKRALAYMTIEFQSAPPPGDDAIQWFYAQTPDADGAGDLAGAEFVYERGQ